MTRILVIEDEAPIRENIAETLEIEGYEVFTAPNGKDGVEIAVQENPDLILCDILMPELDGYGVLNEIRSQRATAHTPFIFLTALANRSAQRKGMEYGADDYLSKPFTPIELLRAIEARLEKHQTLKAAQEKQLDDLRNRIVHALPHELRTPLTGLIGCSDLIQMDAETLTPEDLRGLSDVMLRAAARLQRVIENYLLYTQLEMYKDDQRRIKAMQSELLTYPDMVINEQAVTIAQQANRVLDVKFQLQSADIAISYENFRKIMFEIIENAFKFSEPKTSVTVESWVDVNGMYNVVVSDEGHGMSQADIESIGAYMQFERLLYEQQGLGLGLIIAKRLIEIHGGNLRIESVLKQGTQVYMQLPLA